MSESSPARLLPIALPGARGTSSHAAARRFFGAGLASLGCADAREAVRAVVDRRASYAVLAVENSITGAFHGVADAFFEGDVAVVGEVLLPVRQTLMAVPGTRLEDLSVVTADVASLAQCRDWIASWSLAAMPAEDVSIAAGELAHSEDRALAVIGPLELADVHGLEVLAEGISDKAENLTRFLVIGAPEESADAVHGRRCAVQVGPLRAPRALKTLRIQLESLGASRVRVPFLGSGDGRRFLIEFDHRAGRGPEAAEEACGPLPHRVLGAWKPSARRAG